MRAGFERAPGERADQERGHPDDPWRQQEPPPVSPFPLIGEDEDRRDEQSREGELEHEGGRRADMVGHRRAEPRRIAQGLQDHGAAKERAGELAHDVRRNLAPGDTAARRQREGDGWVQVRARDADEQEDRD